MIHNLLEFRVKLEITGFNGVGCIRLAKDRVQWQVVLNNTLWFCIRRLISWAAKESSACQVRLFCSMSYVWTDTCLTGAAICLQFIVLIIVTVHYLTRSQWLSATPPRFTIQIIFFSVDVALTYAPKNWLVNQHTSKFWTRNRRKVNAWNAVDITHARVQSVLLSPQPSGENVN